MALEFLMRQVVILKWELAQSTKCLPCKDDPEITHKNASCGSL